MDAILGVIGVRERDARRLGRRWLVFSDAVGVAVGAALAVALIVVALV